MRMSLPLNDFVGEIQKSARIEREARDGMSLDNQFANTILMWLCHKAMSVLGSYQHHLL
jgi:hypothetical protein